MVGIFPEGVGKNTFKIPILAVSLHHEIIHAAKLLTLDKAQTSLTLYSLNRNIALGKLNHINYYYRKEKSYEKDVI